MLNLKIHLEFSCSCLRLVLTLECSFLDVFIAVLTAVTSADCKHWSISWKKQLLTEAVKPWFWWAATVWTYMGWNHPSSSCTHWKHLSSSCSPVSILFLSTLMVIPVLPKESLLHLPLGLISAVLELSLGFRAEQQKSSLSLRIWLCRVWKDPSLLQAKWKAGVTLNLFCMPTALTSRAFCSFLKLVSVSSLHVVREVTAQRGTEV